MFIFSTNFNRSNKEKQRALRKLRYKETNLKNALSSLGKNRTGLTEKTWGRKYNDIMERIVEIQSYESKIRFDELLDSNDIVKLNNMFISTKVLSKLSMRLWGDR
ncbi:hypothetical protein ABD87_22595 [Lysinibacillus sphaericus]|uniref:hypothetical protein n=1 Tax=Lysinibacillus sphaericus TaxID=1421 RepID=UPI0018CD2F13|nr:hypothetical protein [Lysinibacillus sphaericus]MBG9732216.1 hypothetical protein [Lysinibacillus sphaericus]